MNTQQTACAHCGASISKNYCAQCGEQHFEENQLSYKNLANQLFVSLTDLDGKVFQSFRLLLFKPGQLLNDYCSGLRKYRLNPFQLFLLANILYFFALSFLQQNTFNTPLDVHMNAANFFHREVAAQWVNQYLLESGLELEEYRRAFNLEIDLQSKTLVILLIPIFAVMIALVFNRQKFIGIRSLVLSTHFFAYVLVFLLAFDLIVGNLLGLAQRVFEFRLSDFVSVELINSLGILIGLMLYLFFAIRRTFDGTWQSHLFKTLILAFGFYVSILFYRSILFFTTYFSLS
jgi:uncharacterized protein DUF3667